MFQWISGCLNCTPKKTLTYIAPDNIDVQGGRVKITTTGNGDPHTGHGAKIMLDGKELEKVTRIELIIDVKEAVTLKVVQLV